MFKRIKNLLDISKYSVEELRRPTEKVFTSTNPEPDYVVTPFNPATIINLKTKHPFDEYETPEQPLDDTATRNG